MTVSKQRAWIFFGLLSLIWGSSFLLMRVGVVEMPPAQVTFTRVGIAAVGMNLVLLLTRRRYPSNWRALAALALIGIGNTAIPFTLLAWGEQTVESGMTSVIQAITPMFALVIAHFTLADERMTPMKVLGVLLAFAGIIVLTSRDFQDGSLLGADLSGELAIIGASLCYAIFTSYSKRTLQKYKVEPVVVSAATMTAAAAAALIFMYTLPLIGERAPVSYLSLSTDVLLSGLMLGVVNTFIAYLLYYYVVAELGASRTTMVTYVVPVVAVTLGALVLNEVIDGRVILGSLLIIAGIALANLRFYQWLRRREELAVASQAKG